MRTRVLSLHLWAALAAGAFVVILGVTGSIMAFEDQIDHLLHPHLFRVTPAARPLTLAELGAAASDRFPRERATAYGLSVSPDLSYSINFRSMTVFVNQYTGDILGTRSGPTWLNNIHQIHLRLLAGNAGKRIVSWAAVVMLFLLVSGVYLWWKRAKNRAWGVLCLTASCAYAAGVMLYLAYAP